MCKRNLGTACLYLLVAVAGSLSVAGANSQAPSPGQPQDQTAAEKQKLLERQKEMEKMLQDLQKLTGVPQTQAPAPAPAPRSSPILPGGSGDKIQFKFDGVSLFEFITNVADMLGITPILIDPDVKGSATIYSSAAMSKDDVFPIFVRVLKNNNAALVKSGNLYSIVPMSQGIKEGLEIIDVLPPAPPTRPVQDKEPQKKAEPPAANAAKPVTAVTTPPTAPVTPPPPAPVTPPPAVPVPAQPVVAAAEQNPPARQPARLATHVIRVEFLPVQSLEAPLKMFMTDGGVIMPYERQNMLIVTDYTDNVQKLLEVIRMLDNSFLDADLIELIEIKFNVAADVLDDLKKVFGSGKDTSTGVYMVSLDRINAILVMANSKRALEEVKRWVGRLDTTTGRSVQTFIYTVENGTASNIAAVLALLFGGTDAGSTGGTQGTAVGGGGLGGGPGGAAMNPGATGGGGRSVSGTSNPSRSMGNFGGNSAYGGGTQNYQQQGLSGGANPYGGGAGIFGGQQVGGPRLSQGAGMTAQVLTGGAFSGLQGTVRLVADDMNNSLIIQGSRADYDYLLETIRRMDILPRQAIIDARIFEIDLTDALSFGVSATLQGRTAGDHLTTGAVAGDTGALNAASFAFIGNSREILMNLNALRQKTKVRILEAPSVLALDGTPARIQVGGSVPVPGSTILSGVSATPISSVNYVDTGTSLYITPRISASGIVTLQIYYDVRTPGPSSSASLGPTFNTTNAETTLAVKDGETVAIAGLIRESDRTGRNGIPFLSDIPILGALFGNSTRSSSRTELLIMITPHVIRTPDKFREMTEDIKSSLRNVGKYADEKTNEMKEDRAKAQSEIEKKVKTPEPPPATPKKKKETLPTVPPAAKKV
jgi:general secretion pathway protein D